MTSLKTRIFMGFIAVLFLATSVGVVIYEVYANRQQSKQQSTQQTNPISKEANKHMLQGTKLADFTPVTTSIDKVQPTDLKAGTGEAVKPGATITFHYTGALAATGIIFQSSHDTGQAVTYPLNQLIKGWQEGIPGMKVGGERRLLIPYAEGYGDAGSPQGGIPPKADLVFDIEITAVKNP